MSNILNSTYHEFQQRAMEARQLAEASGLDFKAIFDCFMFDTDVRFFASDKTGGTGDLCPETVGFKTDVDRLNDWCCEESAQYLWNNIFCFK